MPRESFWMVTPTADVAGDSTAPLADARAGRIPTPNRRGADWDTEVPGTNQHATAYEHGTRCCSTLTVRIACNA